MAVILGSVIGTISGRLDDVVYARTRDGLIARVFTPPTDPGSTRQLLMRDAMQSVNTEWANLSATDRVTWENYGKTVTSKDRFGAPRHRSGRDHFIAWFLAFTGATNAEPVTMVVPASLLTPTTVLRNQVAFYVDVGGNMNYDGSVEWTAGASWPSGTNYCVSYISPELPLTRNFWKQSFPSFGYISFAGAPANPIPLFFSMGGGFDPAAGKRLFHKTRFITADGRLSPFFYHSNISLED